MSESAFSRFWNMVKPPPAGNRPPESPQAIELRRRQRRLVWSAVSAIVVLAAGAGVFNYISNAPQRADKEFQEGMKMMRPGKYPDAVAHFTRALDISSELPDAYLERGNAHRSLGEPDAALADFQRASDLNPSLVAAHNGIAMIYVERRDQRRALEELNKSIGLQPTIEAYFQRGQILEAQGDHQKAIEDYDRAIAQAPDAPYMYRARALARENLGDQEGAHADRDVAHRIERP
jgi:tetratricopeptide (TPR) repeat protein